jgi:hypothetical protein
VEEGLEGQEPRGTRRVEDLRPAIPIKLYLLQRGDLGLSHSYTSPEFELIKQGFVPLDMDERWFIYYEERGFTFTEAGHALVPMVCVLRPPLTEPRSSNPGLTTIASSTKRRQLRESGEYARFLIGTLLLGRDLEYPTLKA